MDRKTKIEQLRKLAAGKLTLEDLLAQLPSRSELYLEGPTRGLFDGMTLQEIEQRPGEPGYRRRIVLIEDPELESPEATGATY